MAENTDNDIKTLVNGLYGSKLYKEVIEIYPDVDLRTSQDKLKELLLFAYIENHPEPTGVYYKSSKKNQKNKTKTGIKKKNKSTPKKEEDKESTLQLSLEKLNSIKNQEKFTNEFWKEYLSKNEKNKFLDEEGKVGDKEKMMEVFDLAWNLDYVDLVKFIYNEYKPEFREGTRNEMDFKNIILIEHEKPTSGGYFDNKGKYQPTSDYILQFIPEMGTPKNEYLKSYLRLNMEGIDLNNNGGRNEYLFDWSFVTRNRDSLSTRMKELNTHMSDKLEYMRKCILEERKMEMAREKTKKLLY